MTFPPRKGPPDGRDFRGFDKSTGEFDTGPFPPKKGKSKKKLVLKKKAKRPPTAPRRPMPTPVADDDAGTDY